jgi:hypothetical protein
MFKWFKKKKRKPIPHFFAKAVIVHCIIVVTVAAYVSLYAQAKGADMTGLFTAIGATFVTELLALMAKTIFKKEEKKDNEDSSFQQDL